MLGAERNRLGQVFGRDTGCLDEASTNSPTIVAAAVVSADATCAVVCAETAVVRAHRNAHRNAPKNTAPIFLGAVTLRAS